MKAKLVRNRLCKGAIVLALAGSLSVCGAGIAFAQTPATGSVDSSSTPAATAQSTLLTTAGVRAGSAGPDFLGITGTNYDFQKSHSDTATDPYPYYATSSKGWANDLSSADQFNRLAVWGTGVNTNANPYYQNLLVNWLLDDDITDGEGALPAGYSMATTHHTNSGTSSWGDVTTTDGQYVSDLVSQDVVFGANKYTNWNSSYGYGLYTQTALTNKNALYTNNDSTNIWTQIYTEEQMAAAVDGLGSVENGTKTLRYGDATDNAVSYEKAIKGQMLYVASQIEQNNTEKKTVAYLYAIDGDGTAYFFVPGTATEGSTAGTTKTATGASSADSDYVSNNSTINMGYMATLPFVTNTFDSGTKFTDTTNKVDGIVMKVEDIWKANPACIVKSTDTDALKNVDVIIYNSTTKTSLQGTSGGCNSSGVNNAEALTNDVITKWASDNKITLKDGISMIAGDDFGTSTNQNAKIESAPLLYCARNYTLDKDTRAAWVFSKVFPEYYGNNDDATYAYWVENIYHVSSDKVASVVAAMTHQAASDVKIYGNNTDTLNTFAETGYNWYQNLADTSDYKSKYAYYTGATRAYWYTNDADLTTAAGKTGETVYTAAQLNANNIIGKNTVGIFAPSKAWTAATTHFTAFPDVKSGLWYSEVVAQAVNLGIFNGNDDGTFAPDRQMNRAELVAALWNYYEPEASAAYDNDADNTTGMADVQANTWYTGAADWAVKNGIISGKEAADGTRYFDPSGDLTRDEICAIIANAAQKYTKADVEGASTLIMDAMADASQVPTWAKQSVAWCLNNGVISGKEIGGVRYIAPLDNATRAEVAAITVQANDNSLLK